MIVLSGRIIAHTTERRELVQALLDWVSAARREPDLAAAYLYEDLEIPAVFNLVSEWKTAAALEAHLHTDSFGVLQGALKVLACPHRLAITRPESELDGAIRAINRLRDEGKAEA